MKTLIHCFVICGLLSTAFVTSAAQIQPFIQDQQLGIQLIDIDWPLTLRKDFVSGFENKILVRVTLLTHDKLLAARDIVIVEKYDLWDEILRIRFMVAGQLRDEKNLKNADEAIMALRNLYLPRIFSLDTLVSQQTLILHADILINPIERERIEHVTQWVAENSVPRVVGSGLPLAAKPNKLFNSIYEQYVHGEEMAAPWRVAVESQPFLPSALSKEPSSNETK